MGQNPDREVSGVADFENVALPVGSDGPRRPTGLSSSVPEASVLRPPWQELESLRPLTLRSCRRIVVVAPHPRDEIRAAGGLLRRLASRHAEVDVLERHRAPHPHLPDAAARARRRPRTSVA